MIAFVSGGARSGKSAFAERLVRDYQRHRGGPRYYLATATPGDSEMAARIARHRAERGDGWRTLEAAALDLALAEVEPGSSLLLDCLTLWASRALFEFSLEESAALAQLERTLAKARAADIALVIVSNDINEGMPPQDDASWRYLALLQAGHCRVAAEADCVVQVVAGLPQVWKGSLP
ncbi:bifunctional adenosylcobinamide kinase/adenosylcobinamide-phosphate guanylyltransferase [Halomonas sp. ML-15]|uniref:bifunctional adenosylcobinamide kinase/adenosylcobinamide-phosphate guanylyltransferase n=1 Tax=Halomonas sp. ML-15 TaxID=2773305 RepID=UPI0017470E38|nr:bifunctional adenosylcobinamide kinase/adenosylcobinamide-phosphate guanylyltransferase [Halomonas sp. ML-15]MBD3897607.1 bifunctional adenosylcobinamide kinase/adenosylcobinamide-phosphate guanylyltransferase [Halomonas sp. ML-15]